MNSTWHLAEQVLDLPVAMARWLGNGIRSFLRRPRSILNELFSGIVCGWFLSLGICIETSAQLLSESVILIDLAR